MEKDTAMQTKRFLCKKGRITIPLSLREHLGWEAGDVLAFEVQGENSLLLHRMHPCQCNHTAEKRQMQKLVETLTPSQQMALLVHLSEAWAIHQKEGR